jgi:hypothetical protein
MKLIYTLVFGLLSLSRAYAQCSDFALGDLQSVQRADVSSKEAKILNLGFDLFAEQQRQSGNIRHYYKCWQTTIQGKPLYDQVLLWDTGNDNIVVGFQQERQYEALRRAITERHSASAAAGNRDHYIGQMFRYYFTERDISGVRYFTVSIANK